MDTSDRYLHQPWPPQIATPDDSHSRSTARAVNTAQAGLEQAGRSRFKAMAYRYGR